MTREQMMDRVIKSNGCENRWTVWFCKRAASGMALERLSGLMRVALAMPLLTMEDEGE